ncbi:MAG: TetR/AcrR family transcriptional regulator [Planctomycetes bacterium]|nr:TetR/AcrR family transcriptional regulator [Planctomycetota bacterium]
MSGNGSNEERDKPLDARARRTQQALLDAFASLVLRQRYDEISIAELLAQAEVGRSTFYEHYRGKDEVLLHSMSGIFEILAQAALGRPDHERLAQLFEHFAEQGQRARLFFLGAQATQVLPRIHRALAERIAVRWREREPGLALALPLELASALLAEAQLGLLRAWLREDRGVSPAELARGCAAASQGLLNGLRAGHCRDQVPGTFPVP